MCDGRTAVIERLKNILLVVLVVSTILLLYFLWYDKPGMGFRDRSGASENIPAIPVSAVLSPESVVVNFGAENYTSPAETATLWYGGAGDAPSFMGALTKFFAFDNIAVSAISEDDFSDVMRARSVRADFPFAMSPADFCAEFGLRRPASTDAVDAFTCVAYSEASPESLFLCDEGDDEFYRLAVDGEAGFKELIAFIESFDNATFYPLRNFSGVENDTLFPLDAGYAPPSELPFTRRPDPDDPNDAGRITEMTRAFFGNRFDFTRKITEGNGTVVYMYGYGEKVFVINRDGSFEYSASPTDSERGGVVTLFDALTTALTFVASHEERDDDRGLAPRRIYLRDARYTFADGRGTYRFTFGVKINGYTVYYADSEPLVVDVTGRHVSYYKRDIIDGLSDGPGSGDGAPAEDAFAPFDLLTEHFAYIYDVLSSEGLVSPMETTADEEAVFETAAAMTSGLASGLLRPSGDAEALTPVWMLTVGGVDFFFDIYTGAPIGYRE
jgi:hypothetical protein